MENTTHPMTQTDFHFSDTQKKYVGKVRDVYAVDDKVILIATDRISAFDVVSKQGIPHKGAVLNQIAAYMLDATKDIVPNWLESVPHPNVAVGKKADVIPIEMVVRGYLAGHAAREYNKGVRQLCGATLPEGLVPNQKLPTPIITPTTKEAEGHDLETSPTELVEKGVVTQAEWDLLSDYALKLFAKGTEIAAERGLLLVDTKYEFGRLPNGDIILIDEIHTPDSSRYFYEEGFEDAIAKGESPKQLSKEFVREWLLARNYSGDGPWPEISEDFIKQISERYIELYEKLVGSTFDTTSTDIDVARIVSV